ncbi:MAG: T9SS type A sorting domain-containing protein [Chryseobacterium sp.]|nr:T9SS type A sorting domain-containing protein [Chryseobacterium sp.]
MNKLFSLRIFLVPFFLYSISVSSQLVKSDLQLWEKANSAARDGIKCKDENLLNFHCGIKDKFIKKYIKYSRDKSHTLSVVHASKESDPIWQNSDKNVSLSNNRYEIGGAKNIELRKRPSIFSFTSGSDPKKGKSDSLKIKFQDQNLYELIFIPKRAKATELNNIHSYLSIKYGISLEKGKYYSSEEKVIWDPEKHGDFNYRPTGLGRDDGNELYQKQSMNTADQILAIGKNDINRTNAENVSMLNNYEFIIWSDDNKELDFKQDGNFNVLKRNWEINFVGPKTQNSDYKVRIEKSLLNPKSLPSIYWMFLKNTFGEIRKIQGVEIDNYVFFNKIEFLTAKENTDTAQFTFAVSPTKGAKDGNSTFANPIDPNSLSIDLDQIVLYPNPVKAGQNFTVRFPAMENLVVSIYDGAGRLVALDKVDQKSTHYVNHLPTQSAYLINLTQNGKIIKTFKLIVE